MANKLFDVDTGLKIGDSYWFAGNGTIIAGDIQVTGPTSVTTIQYENTVYQYATNLSSPNVFITGGSLGVGTDGTVSEMANLYAQVGRFGSLSIANVLITGGSATTLVATNFSAGNVTITGTSTLYTANFSSGNIYQSAADTFVATNFSSGNAKITGSSTSIGINAAGTAAPIANLYTSGVVNAGSVTTANVLMTGDITQSATGTFSYDASTLAPKQYIDVMSVVFGT